MALTIGLGGIAPKMHARQDFSTRPTLLDQICIVRPGCSGCHGVMLAPCDNGEISKVVMKFVTIEMVYVPWIEEIHL